MRSLSEVKNRIFTTFLLVFQQENNRLCCFAVRQANEAKIKGSEISGYEYSSTFSEIHG